MCIYMANGIICPKCGGENRFIGNCEFCGTPLEPASKQVKGELHTKSVHRELRNNSFLTQEKDEFGNRIITTPNNTSCHVGNAMTSHLFIGLLHEVQDNEEHLYICARSHYFGLTNKGKKLYISFGDSSLELHPKEFRNNIFGSVNKEWALFEITEDILLKICESYHLAFKLVLDAKTLDKMTNQECIQEAEDTENDKSDKFKAYARSFYNNLYDPTRYAESLEQATKNSTESGCATFFGNMGMFILLISMLIYII